MVIVATTLKVPHSYNKSLKIYPFKTMPQAWSFFNGLFSDLLKCHWIGFFVMLKNNKKVYKILDYTN